MTHALVGDSVAVPRAEYDAGSMVIHEAGMLAVNATVDADGRVCILPGELARLRQVMRDYYKSLRASQGVLLEVA
jgi:hypothetical protein